MDEHSSSRAALEWVLEKLAAAKKPAQKTPAFKVPEPPKPPAPFKPAAPFKTVGLSDAQKKDRKAKETELWHKWNDGGRKEKDLDPLLNSLGNFIQKRVNVFSRAEVPRSVVTHVHKMAAVDAIKKWDPNNPKGAALTTWIDWGMKHARRHIENNKNLVYNPENIREKIGVYNAFKSDLTEKLGHEPDAQMIHDHALELNHPKIAKWSLKDIKRLEKEQRRSLIQSGHDADELAGSPYSSSRAEEVKLLIVPELTPEERLVHEYTFCLNGKAALQPGAIAKKLKYDNSKVSKLRKSIRLKMSKYLKPGDA
jgi:DNA-directed RNA polymerase specialized sigma subunit